MSFYFWTGFFGLDGCSSNTGRGNSFSFHQTRPDWFRGPPVLLTNECRSYVTRDGPRGPGFEALFDTHLHLVLRVGVTGVIPLHTVDTLLCLRSGNGNARSDIRSVQLSINPLHRLTVETSYYALSAVNLQMFLWRILDHRKFTHGDLIDSGSTSSYFFAASNGNASPDLSGRRNHE